MEKMQELLRILEKNARLSLEDIAAMMDLPADRVAAMMDEANEKGYIHGYQALVDWDKAGINQVEAMIELHVSPRKDRGFEEIAAAIASFEEVDGVMLMSGSYDLLVSIRARASRRLPCLWQSGCPRWTTCFPPPPALCCAPTSAAGSCSRTKRSTKESVPCCDGLQFDPCACGQGNAPLRNPQIL